MKRKLKETEASEECAEDEDSSKKVKSDGRKLIVKSDSIVELVFTENEIDDDDSFEPMDVDSDFDIKKFRQNLKIGNFYDGEWHRT